MADLPALLLASLNPNTRKLAEQNLNAISVHQGFLSHLLRLVLESSLDRAVRLAGSVYLKNIAKLRWEEVSFNVCLDIIELKYLSVGCSTTGGRGQSSSPSRAGTGNASLVQPIRQSNPGTSSRICLSSG